MFTDVVGSTRLIEAFGDAAWVDLRRWHDEARSKEPGMERYANYDTFANVYNRYCWPHSAAVFAVRRRSHHDPGRGSRTAPRSSRSPPPKVAIPIASPMLFATVSSNSSKGWISRLTNVTPVAPTPKPTAPASPIHQWPLAGDHRPRGK